MSEEIVNASQSETTPTPETTSPDTQKAAVDDWRSALGLQSETEVKTPDKTEETTVEVKTDAPATEQPTVEPKLFKLKHNKEEVEVDISTDEKLTDHLQRSLALDKERERVKQSQNDLDRAAKLLGYKDNADLSANLDRIEKEKQQQQQDQFDQMKQKVINDLIYNGVDEQAAIQFAENNPLVQQAREALQEREQAKQENQQAAQAETWQKGWADLYTSFPDLSESSKSFNDGGKPDWYTSEMESMVQGGYRPIDAYKLAHMDKIQTQNRKQTEQQVIKQQMLGNRATVEMVTPSDDTPEVPDNVKSAFEAFGIDPRRAAKHFKK